MSAARPADGAGAPPGAAPLLSIQYLRAVAALMVVCFHLWPQLDRMGYEGGWPRWLMSGIDIFFVISGFIMWITTAERPVSPGQFYRRRIVRIVPLYWLLTSVAVTVLLVRPQWLQTTTFDLWHVLASYSFIAYPRPMADEVTPVLHPGWTLNYEMFFYLLFGLLLCLSRSRRLTAMGAVLGSMVVAGIALRAAGVALHPVLAFYTSSLLLEFWMGMWLGQRYLSGQIAADARWGWVLVVGGFVAFGALPAVEPGWRSLLTVSLPAAGIVLGALMLERRGVGRWRLPLLLGNASYSLYLSHSMLLSAFGQVWRKMGWAELPGGLLLFGVVALGAAVVWGVLLYHWVERPLTRRLQGATAG